MAESITEELRRYAGETSQSPQDTNAAMVGPSPAPQQSITDELRAGAGIDPAAPPTQFEDPLTSGFESIQRQRRFDESGAMIPIDISSGMPDRPGRSADYWRISQQSDPEAKAGALQLMYPDKAVRILDSGDVTLEVIDTKTGKPKDVMINPAGVGSEDMLDLLAQAPEIAASIATAVALRGRGVLKTTAQIVLSALAGGFTSGIRARENRKAVGIPIRGGDILRDSTGEAIFNVAGEGAALAFGKGMRILSPFAREIKPGSLAFNAQAGRNFLKENFGIDYNLTPGQRTGSQALLAIEAAESPLPGARGVMGEIKAKNEEVVQKIMDIATGQVTSDEAIGESAIGTLRRRIVQPIEDAFNTARQVALERGDQRVLDLIDQATGVPRGTSSAVSKTQAGEVTSSAFQRRVIQADEAIDKAYAKVNALPGGSGDVLSGDAAAQAAAEIRREIPAVLKEVETKTGLLDEFGDPLTVTEEMRQQLKSGVPEGLDLALRDLENLKGGKVSLQTLTNMKKAAYDAIAAFKTAHGDAKDRWFTRIASAYEQGIQKGIDQTKSVDLKKALTEARDTYKREMLPIERPGLKELAKTEMDAGQLSPEQVFNRMFSGERAVMNYQRLKEVLGPNSVAFRSLKRAWVDSKIEAARDPVFKTVQPSVLEASFKEMMQGELAKPEIANDIFGGSYNQLMTSLKLRGEMEKIGKGVTLSDNEVKALLSLKDPGVNDLRNLITMSRNRSKVYVNSILKDIADGIPLDDFKPTEFLPNLRNANTSTKDVATILQNLNLDQREAVATSEFYRLLTAASVREGKTASRMIRGQSVNLSPSKLAEAVRDGGERTRMLLGGRESPGVARTTPPQIGQAEPTRLEVLKSIVDTIAPTESATTAFGSLGSLRSGTAVAQVMKGPLKYSLDYVKNMFASLAYTRGVGKLLTNRVIDDEASAILANSLIASEPFLAAAVEAFGPEAAKSMVSEAKQSIDQFVMEQFRSPR